MFSDPISLRRPRPGGHPCPSPFDTGCVAVFRGQRLLIRSRCPYPVHLWWTGQKGRRSSPFHRHDNSRVGLGATIPPRRPSLGLEKTPVRSLSSDFGAWWMSNPAIRPCLLSPNLRRQGSPLTGVGQARVGAEQSATSDERRLSCFAVMKLPTPCV